MNKGLLIALIIAGTLVLLVLIVVVAASNQSKQTPSATSPIPAATTPAQDTSPHTQVPPPRLLPDGINNGMIVHCPATGGIYKVENNAKRWYSLNAYIAAGNPPSVDVACATIDAIPSGPNM